MLIILLNLKKQKKTLKQHKEDDPEFAKEIQQKSVETRKKNNGEDYTNRKKCKLTMRELYNVENAFLLGSVKEQIKKNNIDKYGVEYYSSTDECKQKVATTNLERYGAECYFASEQGKLKILQTLLENFGVKCSFQSDVVKDKIKHTNLDKYGCESPMQNEEIRSKAASKYKYNDISFDSSTELAMYIYLTDNNVKFKFHNTKKLLYLYKEKQNYIFVILKF